MTPIVKYCPKCGARFDVAGIARDPDVVPIGMLIDGTDPRTQLYYFNHACEGCGTTFAIAVEDFRPQITESIPDEVRTGLAGCRGHCTRIEDLSDCDAPCRHAPYRRFLLRMRAQSDAARTALAAAGKDEA